MKRTQKIVLGIVTLATLGILAASYARGMGMGLDGGCAMAGMEGKGMEWVIRARWTTAWQR